MRGTITRDGSEDRQPDDDPLKGVARAVVRGDNGHGDGDAEQHNPEQGRGADRHRVRVQVLDDLLTGCQHVLWKAHRVTPSPLDPRTASVGARLVPARRHTLNR